MQETALGVLALVTLVNPLVAQEPAAEESAVSQPFTYDAVREALKEGNLWLNFRYRYEFVDDDNFSRDARASTLRSAIGYRTGEFHGLSGTLEMVNVSQVVNDDRYDSTQNGEAQYPKVIDPRSTNVNQAFANYVYEDAMVRAGRQEITLDNQRFVGNVGWRQNHQTFDSVMVGFDGIENLSAHYAYVDDVHRITDSKLNTETHIAHANYAFPDFGSLTGYFYSLDIQDVKPLSTNTAGARLTGALPVGEEVTVDVQLEYAHQWDEDRNPGDVDTDYYTGVLGAKIEHVGVEAGVEVLGGEGGDDEPFQTPLATAHKFNGWADQFAAATPDDGLVDYWLGGSCNVDKFTGKAIYHVFEAEDGNDDYGSELDLLVSYGLNDHTKFGLKFANFWDDNDFGALNDVTKVWFYIEYGAL